MSLLALVALLGLLLAAVVVAAPLAWHSPGPRRGFFTAGRLSRGFCGSQPGRLPPPRTCRAYIAAPAMSRCRVCFTTSACLPQATVTNSELLVFPSSRVVVVAKLRHPWVNAVKGDLVPLPFLKVHGEALAVTRSPTLSEGCKLALLEYGFLSYLEKEEDLGKAGGPKAQ